MIRSPSRPHWSQTGLVALAAFVLLTGAGCPDKHIGRLCQIPSDAGADGQPPTGFGINALALECPSRICIKPTQQVTTDTTSLCTDECSSDDDCADGEKRDPKDTTDFRCQGGFVCRTPIPKLLDVPFACKRLCVCKDFGIGNSVPDSCK